MARPTRVTVKIVEATDDHETTSMHFYLGSVIDTLASIEAACQSVVEALQACITGSVTSVQITVPVDTTGWTLAPSDGTDTDKLVGARLIMSSADPFYAQLNLPTFDLAKLVDTSSKDVDQDDADITAFLAALVGTTLTTNQDQEVSTIDAFYRTYGGKK